MVYMQFILQARLIDLPRGSVLALDRPWLQPVQAVRACVYKHPGLSLEVRQPTTCRRVSVVSQSACYAGPVLGNPAQLALCLAVPDPERSGPVTGGRPARTGHVNRLVYSSGESPEGGWPLFPKLAEAAGNARGVPNVSRHYRSVQCATTTFTSLNCNGG